MGFLSVHVNSHKIMLPAIYGMLWSKISVIVSTFRDWNEHQRNGCTEFTECQSCTI